jgi:hypothetical protein
MHPEPLTFPRGVRYPRIDEIPGGSPSDAAARIAEAQRTPITTGFLRIDRPEAQGYSSVVEANVQPADLWRVFVDLVNALLPAAAAPIVGIIDEDPELGDYTARQAALDVLAPFKDMLVHDGFLEFGCMFQRAGRTEEVFVPSAKFLRIWTNHPERAERVLNRHGIPNVPQLRFIDEFPLVREAQPFGDTESGWFTVVEALRPRFHDLPEPPSDVEAV